MAIFKVAFPWLPPLCSNSRLSRSSNMMYISWGHLQSYLCLQKQFYRVMFKAQMLLITIFLPPCTKLSMAYNYEKSSALELKNEICVLTLRVVRHIVETTIHTLYPTIFHCYRSTLQPFYIKRIYIGRIYFPGNIIYMLLWHSHFIHT